MLKLNKIIFLLIINSCIKRIYPNPSYQTNIKNQHTVIRSKVSIRHYKNKIKFNLKATVIKNKIIFISLRGSFGIEGLRIVIKKDKIVIYDTLKRNIDIYSYQKINKILNIDLNFNMIQNIILGKDCDKDNCIQKIHHEVHKYKNTQVEKVLMYNLIQEIKLLNIKKLNFVIIKFLYKNKNNLENYQKLNIKFFTGTNHKISFFNIELSNVRFATKNKIKIKEKEFLKVKL